MKRRNGWKKLLPIASGFPFTLVTVDGALHGLLPRSVSPESHGEMLVDRAHRILAEDLAPVGTERRKWAYARNFPSTLDRVRRP